MERSTADRAGSAAVRALLEEARRITGPTGKPLHLVILRVDQRRPEDSAVLDYLGEPNGLPGRPDGRR